MIKRTERGWAGHFNCSHQCLFRRNTLIEGPNDRVIVSTVGAKLSPSLDTIGFGGRYYETEVFGVTLNGSYLDSDVSDQRSFNSPQFICAKRPEELPHDVDNQANDMHEAVISEMMDKLEEQ